MTVLGLWLCANRSWPMVDVCGTSYHVDLRSRNHGMNTATYTIESVHGVKQTIVLGPLGPDAPAAPEVRVQSPAAESEVKVKSEHDPKSETSGSPR